MWFPSLFTHYPTCLVLYNDRIIDKSQNKRFSTGLQPVNYDASTSAVAYKNNKKSQHVYRLKVILTTLEYCEVFIEISAKRIFGVKGKWLFVALVQFAKAAGRFSYFSTRRKKNYHNTCSTCT
ncbi:unnamed protein product [Ceratitis capitata]|uniref:Peroxisomal membrane protein PEX16 n=1 Tax=Ceratitis capitata TaxID=7213 RepID=A0A811V1K9_CERCA|nr:unnamed protein product [Ceratitis capitata]